MESNRPMLDRLKVIHRRLQEGRFPNRTTLAKALEINIRTVSRYIDFMRDRLDLPVEFNEIRGGYHYTRPVETLPIVPEAVTESELFAMLVATKALAQYKGTPWHGPLKKAFRKMTSGLESKDLSHLEDLASALDIRLAAHDELDATTFSVLHDAIVRRRTLIFNYRCHAQQAVAERRVEPYLLACVNNRWYLIGKDLDRDALRAFVVGRIRNCQPTLETFRRPADFIETRIIE